MNHYPSYNSAYVTKVCVIVNESCPAEFKSIYYRRFVDDCFVVFREISNLKQFHDFINKQHENLKITVEIEQEEKLPFLDCMLDKSDSSLISSVYRKPTFTGLGLCYFSFIPYQFKINSIRTLIRKAYQISTDFFCISQRT